MFVCLKRDNVCDLVIVMETRIFVKKQYSHLQNQQRKDLGNPMWHPVEESHKVGFPKLFPLINVESLKRPQIKCIPLS